ncbi:MAG TPA: hypothetical protein VMM92_02525, partial [Thermoanaerobaculia bacterium]|nr:hypothetical protein [Thermoanaerobaculia bacterium]
MRRPSFRSFQVATAATVCLAVAACSPGGKAAAPPPTPQATAAPAPPSLDPPAGAASVGLALGVAGPDLLLTWVEPSGSFATPIFEMRLSRFSGGRWSVPVTVAKGTDLLANWADFPGVIAQPGGGLFAHWLIKKGEGYGIEVAHSKDGGATWSPLGALAADPSAGEHGFLSYAPEGDGVRAFWLEGSEGGAASLRSARLHPSGQSPIGPIELLDDRVCDCCQTSAALTASGPVVVYRDRSDKEIRDISALRHTAAGWGKPVAVHADGWEIPGCPINGPAAAAEERRVAVAWFTSAPPGPRVEVAFSEDAGASFGPAVVVDAGRPVGRVDLKLEPSGAALVSWVAPTATAGSDKAAIWLRRV